MTGSPQPPALHLAIALEGAGWHPAAWREDRARPDELFTARYWADLVLEAERGLVDFVTIEDALTLQSSRFDGPDGRTDQVRGRLDAVQIAARVAPLTTHVGLVPTVTVTHTEPFHVSKAIATLDYITSGRAGWRAQVSRPADSSLFGRRQTPTFHIRDFRRPEAQAAVGSYFDEAADFVEVVRRLWDSWEDDAEIRDADTGRFVDRDKLHYIDFEGKWFSVRGPSIVPRPPQGQPLVTALAHATVPYRFGARSTDVVYVTPHDASEALVMTQEVRAEQEAAGRHGEPVLVFADLVVFLDETASAAQQRKAGLDQRAGGRSRSDALVFVGTAAELADLLLSWQWAGLAGYRLRPGTVPHDLEAISRTLVPELQRRGAFRAGYEASTLRGLLGLARPTNRYGVA
ncbi:MAG TPA: LLM class flavin-dependent oxidoreductase [Acidimicrobiales bacterium]|jgi:alkanesulfonate monooxygenase SsuD/methylene tetrahydromethanopterin reductase-like flavin-dependent oxidoreductase (luciferase family)|nr:LLM class flavin-dependent oxidoreductase [Acidimicrobiales bacterium]